MQWKACTACLGALKRPCTPRPPPRAGEGRNATPTFLAGCALALGGFTLYSHAQIARLRSRGQPAVAVLLEGGAKGSGRQQAGQGALPPASPKVHGSRVPLLVPIQLTR